MSTLAMSSSVLPLLRAAVVKGLRAARQNWPAIIGLQSAMFALVVIYYAWPLGSGILARYAAWQASGGVLGAAFAAMIAGGLLAEVSVIYLQDRGRWTMRHVDSILFKSGLFFIGGGLVYEFYQWQAYMFGDGLNWRVILPKVLVDQLGFTVFWAAPFQTFFTRWHALDYSFPRLRAELGWRFVGERMLPVLITNWAFWLPGVTLIYAMPVRVQTPLFIFATAIWGLLLAALAQPHHAVENAPIPTTLLEPEAVE